MKVRLGAFAIASALLAARGSASPASRAPAAPTPAPQASAIPLELPSPEPSASVAPSATATASPTPIARPRYVSPPLRYPLGRIRSSTSGIGAPPGTPEPLPSRTPEPNPAAVAPPTAFPSSAPTSPESLVPTPIPTAKPTPRSIAPEQPTIPESVDDPTVRGIINRPIRELSQVGWMTGTWSAHSVEQHSDGTSHDRGINTYVFGPTMKGRYVFGADGKARDYLFLTYDPFARHWVLVRFEGNPSYGIWTSETGWRGNRIEFLTNFSYANGRQYRRRLTIIHKDPRTFGIYDEEQLPDGNWTPDDAVELKRQS